MVQTSRFLILILAGSLMACSKATPDFELLDPDAIPQPKFSGSTTKSINTTSDTATFQITGQCDPKIRSLNGRAVNIATAYSSVDNLTISGATVACATSGTFSFELKSLTGLGYTAVVGQTYEIELRGMTSAGNSRPSYIRITYSSPVGAPHLLLSGGGVHSGLDPANRLFSTTFQADVRTSHIQAPIPAPTSLNFTLKIGTAGRY